jgi:hypothetical protein
LSFIVFYSLVNILLHLWEQCIIEQTPGYQDARFRECLVEILSAPLFFPLSSFWDFIASYILPSTVCGVGKGGATQSKLDQGTIEKDGAN